MEFIPTKIPDVILIEPKIFGDERGFFVETYREDKFIEAGSYVYQRLPEHPLQCPLEEPQ